jgi:starch phosphorylase
VGSHKINGVSALHTALLRRTVFKTLDAAKPGRIVNKTNGISLRRWLFQANPMLTSLLTDTLGEQILDDSQALTDLERLAADPDFVRRFSDVKRNNKERLAKRIRETTGIQVAPAALFDVQVKRIHEYKRQLLNLLETVALFSAIRSDPLAGWAPRVKIFAGKAAADYTRAKLIIKLAHDVGRAINADATVGPLLKVVFLPNYSVSLAEEIIPAADLSEQISTAGMEASGTGNMKLALNGALTIGTLDGANVEILERVGAENFFAFGLTSDAIEAKRAEGFSGREAAQSSPRLADAIGSIASGLFSSDEPDRYRILMDAVLDYDHFMVAADFEAYWKTQRAVDSMWKRPDIWSGASILNTSRVGWFSSDRAIREYADEIWGLGG